MRRHTIVLMLFLAAHVAGAGAGALRAQSTRPHVLVLSPEAGERVPSDEVLVALSVNSDVVDSTSVKIEVDGQDVTAAALISGAVVTWRPAEPLAPGPHRVVVNARTKSGEKVESVSWTFSVAPRTALAVAGPVPGGTTSGGSFGSRLHGSVIVEGSGNSVSGEGAAFSRQEDFLPRVWVNAGGILAPGWSYTARVHASGYETAVEQPVNRYRADLRAPFFSVAVGDVNPFYQDLILSGLRVRGVQGDLKAGPLRLSAVTGKTKRAVPGLLDPQEATGVLRTGTFGQNLLAIRPALGSGTLFQAGLTVMHVRDDVNSIPDLRAQPLVGDSSTRTANPPPKDNLVAGLDLTLRLARGRVLLQYANAASLLANDISGGPLTRAGLDSLFDSSGTERLNVDPAAYSDFFILNASLIPLDPRGLTNLAHQVRTSVRAGSHQLGVEWRSIGGSYYTLGYPAMQRDVRGVRVSDAFTLLDDALVVSAVYEQDHDNLDDVKTTTTTGTGAFLTASWQKSRDALLITASGRLGKRSNGLPIDRFESLDETSKALSGGVSIPVSVSRALRTRVSLNTSLVDRTDPANVSANIRDLYYLGGVQAENHELTSQYGLLFGINRSELTSQNNARTDFKRLLATVRHQFSERFTGLFDGTATTATSPETADALGLHYNRMELLGGGEYARTSAAVIALTGGVVSYDDKRAPGHDTREVLVRIRMSRSF